MLRRTLDNAANNIAHVCAHPYTVACALAVSGLWLACGPYAGWSTSYLAWMQNATALVTFVLAFVILAAGARSEAAIQLKLDELLRASQDARNALIAAEAMDTDDIRSEAEKIKKGK